MFRLSSSRYPRALPLLPRHACRTQRCWAPRATRGRRLLVRVSDRADRSPGVGVGEASRLAFPYPRHQSNRRRRRAAAEGSPNVWRWFRQGSPVPTRLHRQSVTMSAQNASKLLTDCTGRVPYSRLVYDESDECCGLRFNWNHTRKNVVCDDPGQSSSRFCFMFPTTDECFPPTGSSPSTLRFTATCWGLVRVHTCTPRRAKQAHIARRPRLSIRHHARCPARRAAR